MAEIDLIRLREMFSEQEIMICFNGPFSQSIIEELGNAVKRYMESEAANRSSMMDVFSVFIEQTQNIRNYIEAKKDAGKDILALDSGTLVIAKQGDNYIVNSGNLVENGDVDGLKARLDQLASLDRKGLKTLFKEQLHKPHTEGGAGLGLIEMARQASKPLGYSFKPQDAEHTFFSLRAIV